MPATSNKLSGFEVISEGVPESEWLNTPQIVQYVRDNFETRYCPEILIAKLGLRFSDPELNGHGKHTKLVKETTTISLEELPLSEHPTYQLDAEVSRESQ